MGLLLSRSRKYLVELHFRNEVGGVAATARLFASNDADLSVLDLAEAAIRSQEPIQLAEDQDYEFELTDPSMRLHAPGSDALITPSRNPARAHCGTLNAGGWLGRLRLEAIGPEGLPLGVGAVEVRSRKLSYEGEFRTMLEDISNYSVELALEMRAPTELLSLPDPAATAGGLYQQFAFVRGLLGSAVFENALRRVLSHPHIALEPLPISRSVTRPFRPRASHLRSLARSVRRVPVPASHPLAARLSSISSHVDATAAIETTDTPENRFVKFVLATIDAFLLQVMERSVVLNRGLRERFATEVAALRRRLDTYSSSSFFRGLGDITALPLSSTVLQRREGYREIYQAWLQFSLAARITWAAGEDTYSAGQQRVSLLYEYWVFFQLCSMVSRVSGSALQPQQILEPTRDGFGIRLRRGQALAVAGRISRKGKDLRLRLAYNWTFRAGTAPAGAGSWTQRMSPDYTLSLWPADRSESDAEASYEMAHVHFDAKYSVRTLRQLFGRSDRDFDSAEVAARDQLQDDESGTSQYKRDSLLKMHAYRDAIRRSYGAFVLYPGDTDETFQMYHELLPGLGAFVLRPSRDNPLLFTFLDELIDHVADPTTARSLLADRTAELYAAP